MFAPVLLCTYYTLVSKMSTKMCTVYTFYFTVLLVQVPQLHPLLVLQAAPAHCAAARTPLVYSSFFAFFLRAAPYLNLYCTSSLLAPGSHLVILPPRARYCSTVSATRGPVLAAVCALLFLGISILFCCGPPTVHSVQHSECYWCPRPDSNWHSIVADGF